MTPFVVGRSACREHAQKLKSNSLKAEERDLILTLNKILQKDGFNEILPGGRESMLIPWWAVFYLIFLLSAKHLLRVFALMYIGKIKVPWVFLFRLRECSSE